MRDDTFSLVMDGIDITDDSTLSALYEAGFDDTTFGVTAGVPYAQFNRSHLAFPAAVVDAIRDLESAVPGARVVRVEPDEFVSTTEIGHRTGRSRESIRLLAEGKRGPGRFPAPALLLHGRQPIWHWSEVAAWFQRYEGLQDDSVERAEFLAAINGALELRRHGGSLRAGDGRRAVAALVQQVEL